MLKWNRIKLFIIAFLCTSLHCIIYYTIFFCTSYPLLLSFGLFVRRLNALPFIKCGDVNCCDVFAQNCGKLFTLALRVDCKARWLIQIESIIIQCFSILACLLECSARIPLASHCDVTFLLLKNFFFFFFCFSNIILSSVLNALVCVVCKLLAEAMNWRIYLVRNVSFGASWNKLSHHKFHLFRPVFIVTLNWFIC